MDVATFVTTIFDGNLPVRIEAFDGSVGGEDGAPVTIVVRNRDALRRVLTHPGELGLARAYVAGDLDVEGDLDALVSLDVPSFDLKAHAGALAELARSFGASIFTPVAAPSIEARSHGVLHSRRRDARSVTHHYDVSNRFYQYVLGPSMTYSCALFATPEDSLESAQIRKVDLVARKLGLKPGDRLLDVGCGWGTMAIHAARTYGARVVGVTLSKPQARYASDRARALGLGDLVEFRVQDYRDVTDGPFDAISSIGMAEHVGRRGLPTYTDTLTHLLVPGGRFLNHAIGRPATHDEDPRPTRLDDLGHHLGLVFGTRRGAKTGSAFIDRYVFPDGELHQVGDLVGRFQSHGLEVRHLESLREHYALTLRHWVANLERHWGDAVAEVGEARARVWRLYMAASAVAFERHHLEVHQILMVRPDRGASHLALRATVDFEPDPDVVAAAVADLAREGLR